MINSWRTVLNSKFRSPDAVVCFVLHIPKEENILQFK